jgi:hypothetical protein
MPVDVAEQLVADLTAAQAAGGDIAGRPALGVRAVEPAPGRRWYLRAFEGPEFLCLRADLRPEREERPARRIAAASLLYEHAETLVDPDALRDLARAASRLLASGTEQGPLVDAVAVLAQEALDLAAWREAPERALASLTELERGAARHERLRTAYAAFVTASEPLVAVQGELPAQRVADLRALEEAAGRAGVAEPLSATLGAAVPACDEGAAEILAAHLTPLAGD